LPTFTLPTLSSTCNSLAGKMVLFGGVSEEEALKFVTLNPAKVPNSSGGGGATVLYRINSGGPPLSSTDGEPLDWDIDTKNNASPFFIAGSNLTYSNIPSGFINNTSYPDDLFFSERWDSKSGDNMRYEFPVINGLYTVNLMFAEIFDGGQAIGYRVLGAIIEGDTVMQNFDAVAEAGFKTAVVKSFTVDVQDGSLAVEIFRTAGSAAIKGIEIIQSNATQIPDTWTQIPNSPDHIPRHENSMVQAGNKLYLFGGRESPQMMEGYDFTTDSWSFAGFTPKAFNHFQATEYQGLIWVICAFQDNAFPNETPETNIYLYDPADNDWITGPEIPASRRRGGAGLVVHNGQFYIIGGNTDGHNGGYVSMFDRYDPQTNTWTVLPDAPHARDHFHASVHDNKLYAVGGRLSGGPGGIFAPMIPEVDVYDFNTGSWLTLPIGNNLPTPRAAAAVVSFHDQVVVMGGEGNGQAYATVEAYDVNSNTWDTLSSLNHPRHGTQAVVSGDGIIISSGSPFQGSGSQTNMEVYGLDNPSGDASDASELSCPDTLVFIASGTQSVSLQVKNGNQAVFVRSLEIIGTDTADFGISSLLSEDFLIPSEGQKQIDIVFTPSGSGPKTAKLDIQYGKNSSKKVVLEFHPPNPNSVIFRVNAGGPQLSSHDGAPQVWTEDSKASPSPWFVSGSNATYSDAVPLTNTTSYPDAIFQAERWDSKSGAPMAYEFPLPNGYYTVNLLFAEIFGGAQTPGSRVFGVLLEGDTVLAGLDVSSVAGYQTAHLESHLVAVNDGQLSLSFFHIANNPSIKGIEVLQATPPQNRFAFSQIQPRLKMYPNPLEVNQNPFLRIENAPLGRFQYSLYQASGQIVKQGSDEIDSLVYQKKLAIRPLAPGLYLLRIKGNGWEISQKIFLR
ncbi:MAG: malectin domain-containing carbohydrate-binding protein, partial [Bacteroidota bacterium]